MQVLRGGAALLGGRCAAEPQQWSPRLGDAPPLPVLERAAFPDRGVCQPLRGGGNCGLFSSLLQRGNVVAVGSVIALSVASFSLSQRFLVPC